MKSARLPSTPNGVNKSLITQLFFTSFLVSCTPKTTVPANDINAILDGDHRVAAHVERDRYRNPAATIDFFGVTPEMDIIEVNPGRGYYLEILAPFISGTYLVAGNYDLESESNYIRRSTQILNEKLDSDEIYKDVKVVHFDTESLEVPEASVDAVLTFRNIHSFSGDNGARNSFKLFFEALKPGGILGVVQHRSVDLPEEVYLDSLPSSQLNKTGYMPEAYVIDLAESQGFTLESQTEINANPLDSGDHPKGVWTLPPSLSAGDEDKEKYLNIGESDRMTLRFRKPAS